MPLKRRHEWAISSDFPINTRHSQIKTVPDTNYQNCQMYHSRVNFSFISTDVNLTSCWLTWHKCQRAYVIMNYLTLLSVLMTTYLIVETSYLAHVCTYGPRKCTWNVKSIWHNFLMIAIFPLPCNCLSCLYDWSQSLHMDVLWYKAQGETFFICWITLHKLKFLDRRLQKEKENRGDI